MHKKYRPVGSLHRASSIFNIELGCANVPDQRTVWRNCVVIQRRFLVTRRYVERCFWHVACCAFMCEVHLGGSGCMISKPSNPTGTALATERFKKKNHPAEAKIMRKPSRDRNMENRRLTINPAEPPLPKPDPPHPPPHPLPKPPLPPETPRPTMNIAAFHVLTACKV